MRLNHVTLIVAELERSVAFYRALGLTQIVEAAPRYARFQLPEGGGTLSVEVTGQRPAGGEVQVYLESDRLDALCAELAARGVRFDQPPTDMPYGWREAHLRDPDGHALRLYHAGSYRLDPPWKLPPERQ